jgi:hypothetical protein
MAWDIHYSGSFYNIAERHVVVEILSEDYSGAILPLRIQSVSISQEWDAYLSPAMGAGCEVTIVNEESDWDFYEELFVAEEQQFMLRIYFEADKFYISDYIIFEGFLLTDIQEQQVLPHSEIKLKAGNYLGVLDEIKKSTATSTSTNNIINYIGRVLQVTKLMYPIYVCNTLYETLMTNQRLMTDLYLHRHLFFQGVDEDNKLEYGNLLEILNTVLKPFNMYVYSWNHKWYIERYADIFHPDGSFEYNFKTYDVYDITTLTYGSTIQYNLPILTCDPNTINFYTFKYVDTSQTLQYGKGYKKISVNGVAHKDHNLVSENFDDATPMDITTMAPANVIERWSYDNTGTITYGEDWVQFHNPGDQYAEARGIATRFVLRGTKKKEITLNISFRRQLTDMEIYYMITNKDTWEDGDIENIKVSCRIMLHYYDPNTGHWYYLTKDSETGTWGNHRWTSPEIPEEQLWAFDFAIFTVGGTPYTPLKSYQYDEEEHYYYWQVDETITFNNDFLSDSQDDTLLEDLLFELRLLRWSFYYEHRQYVLGVYVGNTEFGPTNIDSPLLRKIRITTDDEDEEERSDIEISGETDANYISELDFDIDIYDVTNHVAANATWVNAATWVNPIYPSQWLDARTEEEESIRELSLQEHLLEDLFQFYNKPRKKLVTTIRFDYHLPPFSFIRDPNITRDGTTIDMLILSYTLDVNTMQYEIEAEEWCADDDYHLVEGEMILAEASSGWGDESWMEPESESESEAWHLHLLEYTNYDCNNLSKSGGGTTSFTELWVKYYNTSTHVYRNVLKGTYGVPSGIYINVHDIVSLPITVGSYVESYFIVNEGYNYNGQEYDKVLDSPVANEIIDDIYIKDGTYVWKLDPTYFVEYHFYDMYDIYLFTTNFAYLCRIERVEYVGGE